MLCLLAGYALFVVLYVPLAIGEVVRLERDIHLMRREGRLRRRHGHHQAARIMRRWESLQAGRRAR